MAALFASGRIVDLILVLVMLEVAALLVWRRRRGHGPSPAALLSNLGSGAALMLALRAALTGADWTIIALCLLAALLAHGADLALRLRDHSTSHPVAVGRRDPDTEAGPSAGTSAKNAAFPARP